MPIRPEWVASLWVCLLICGQFQNDNHSLIIGIVYFNKQEKRGVPALLIYKGGNLIGNFVRLADEFGEDFFATDIEAFLVDHGILPDQNLIPELMKKSGLQISQQDDSDEDWTFFNFFIVFPFFFCSFRLVCISQWKIFVLYFVCISFHNLVLGRCLHLQYFHLSHHQVCIQVIWLHFVGCQVFFTHSHTQTRTRVRTQEKHTQTKRYSIYFCVHKFHRWKHEKWEIQHTVRT